ncbi:hypothetical protein N7520_002772 [Penicillium odoratum]|uniref:uncharacterized protein n=1 Tax=Penicillium odoratum TaxID=1167516 RepID=UPI002547C536|nr:uncharacterized protein N7520_002772 [Penicillium odoratum]KAJ5772243.1 hypothetical protein N7520_002772 [Penicillium odoratum]
MKLTVFVLLGASLGLALPVHETVSTVQTALANSRNVFLSTQQLVLDASDPDADSTETETEPQTQAPTIQQYISHRREELGFLRSNKKEFNLPNLKPTPSNPGPFSQSDYHKSASSYGVFLGKWLPFEDQNHQCKSTEVHTVTYLKPLDLLDIMEKYAPICLALVIFVLVPIAYFVLELLEIVLKYFVRERFPHRGRDRLQLLGPERQLRTVSNWEREKVVQGEKRWWQPRRSRN